MRRALPPACSISRCARSSSALLRASRPTPPAGGGKPDRQPLTDASSRPRYEHTGIRQTLHSRGLPILELLFGRLSPTFESLAGASGGALPLKPPCLAS